LAGAPTRRPSAAQGKFPVLPSLPTCGESITELEKSGVREGRKH
jgi:hypothetical protein